ncbi:MAG: YceI-like domain protein [Planctomycetaceae bacterium]|nr:YceI-like domain protein [Planctomycetaceae bacterium]
MLRFQKFSVLALIAMSFFATGTAVEAQDATELTADLKTSKVYVLVDKTGLGHPHGVVGALKSGAITLDAKADAGQIVFDMETFMADTDEARKYVGLEGQTDAGTQKKDSDNMLGSAVLDVNKFPTATFDIESALKTDKKSVAGNPVYALKGQFTLHGATRPLTIGAEVITKGKTTRLRGKFKVQQTKYGMKPYTAALGTVGVADELTIWGDIYLKP